MVGIMWNLVSARRSTFQLVVASGVQGTYAIFAYDRISNDKAQ
uniref:HIG1 domain-containing protein n=1 Tax=Romanomermis culicivorax TaxID=13658 RepID=A0A915IID6_ROMCU